MRLDAASSDAGLNQQFYTLSILLPLGRLRVEEVDDLGFLIIEFLVAKMLQRWWSEGAIWEKEEMN